MRNNNTHTQWTLAGVIIVIRPRRPTHAGHLKFMEKTRPTVQSLRPKVEKEKLFKLGRKTFFSLFFVSPRQPSRLLS